MSDKAWSVGWVTRREGSIYAEGKMACTNARGPRKTVQGAWLKQGVFFWGGGAGDGDWRGPVGEGRSQQSELSCRVSCSKTLTLAPPAVTASPCLTPQHL